MNIEDQPPPQATDLPPSWEAVISDMRTIVQPTLGRRVERVIQDMAERDQAGRSRYGVPLTPNNGRDSLIDLYQEVLDAAVYAKNWLMEDNLHKKDSVATVYDVYLHLLHTTVMLRDIISLQAGDN